MTSALGIQSVDDALYNYQFELTIKSTVEEEQTWYNTTLIKISFVKPSCKVSQESIDNFAGSNTLYLSAV